MRENSKLKTLASIWRSGQNSKVKRNVIWNVFQNLRFRNKFAMTTKHGFTLIEMIVVITIIMIISTIGIASFVDYGRTQEVNTATLEIASMLQLARSRTISQIRPPDSVVQCSGKTLDGYRVTFSDSRNYLLKAVCEGNEYNLPNESRTLSSNLSITSLSFPNSFTFRVLTGGVDGVDPAGTNITVSGYGKTKTIMLYNNGRIVAN